MPDESPAHALPSLAADNVGFVESLLEDYLVDPDTVPGEWRPFLARLAATNGGGTKRPPGGRPRRSLFNPAATAVASPAALPSVPVEELEVRVAALSSLRLFEGVGREEIEAVARLATSHQLADGEVVFREGESGRSLHVLIAGELVVRRGGEILANLAPGEVAGELAVLDEQPRTADVVARGPSTTLCLEGEALMALVERRPALMRGLVRVLLSRLRQRSSRQDKVNQLVHAYRVRGHLQARLDPLGSGPHSAPELELGHYGLGERDLDSLFSSTSIAGTSILTLREILERLRSTYCGSIGVQFMHIDEPRKKQWLQEHLEDLRLRRRLSREEQLRILEKLTDAEIFEQFVHRKFLGAKRFSLEGAESLIPLLDLAIEEASEHGVKEVVLGMAHRGRLNVLINVLGKSPREVFREFADADSAAMEGRGDVKYHLGFSADRRLANGAEMHLSLCFNPSHLEFVSPVAVGRVRAKQDRFGDREHRTGLGIVIHGDAAFAGQGVVQELLNLSALHGYRTGGTLHIVVNNQLGFTTPPESGRSTHYATDVARMLQTPVFHVNGEDPEAVAHVVRLAMGYRREFGTDVIVDMYCYRRHGHNEGDEPSYTQPLMYRDIKRRKTVREAYLANLLLLGGIERQEAEEIVERRKRHLDQELSKAQRGRPRRKTSSAEALWKTFRGGLDARVPVARTGVERDLLAHYLRQLSSVPEGFHLHPKLRPFLERRHAMANGELPLDWAAAEALAFASLVAEGAAVRLSGQDSGRGTFSQRHAVLHDTEDGSRWVPLQHIGPGQAPFRVFDSPLSEIAVLGFEYGYSLDSPDGLVLWEAQFGDFCNVAQVFIDQFLTSGEDKWRRLSGLALLLPHGFEGQGPEHSSARLERFLNLTAEDNIQVVNLTTPAQLFHCLRRQVLRPWRKPLVVMAPKSLLRHPEATSPLEELASGGFRRCLADPEPPQKARKVLLCSGKVYYDLVAARRQTETRDVAIVRLEQYYPLTIEQLEEALAPYGGDVPLVWVQEEPRNMGAWTFLWMRFGAELSARTFACVARPESASPATGSASAHQREQQRLLDEALA